MFSLWSAGPSEAQKPVNPRTEPEKIEKDDQIETFIRALSDRSNDARNDIICVLCKEIYGLNSLSKPFEEPMAELKRLCHNDPAILARMLQTPFIDGQTPVQWIFGQLPDVFFGGTSEMQKVPPVVDSVVDACMPDDLDEAPQTSGVLEALFGIGKKAPDVMEVLTQVCCERDGNALYQLYNDLSLFNKCQSTYKITVTKQTLQGYGSPYYDYSRQASNNYSWANFTIPHFPERMLVDGFIDLRFVALGTIFSVRLQTTTKQNQWSASFSYLRPLTTNRTLNINVYFGAGSSHATRTGDPHIHFTSSWTWSATVNNEKINPLIASDRSMKGYVRIGPY